MTERCLFHDFSQFGFRCSKCDVKKDSPSLTEHLLDLGTFNSLPQVLREGVPEMMWSRGRIDLLDQLIKIAKATQGAEVWVQLFSGMKEKEEKGG